MRNTFYIRGIQFNFTHSSSINTVLFLTPTTIIPHSHYPYHLRPRVIVARWKITPRNLSLLITTSPFPDTRITLAMYEKNIIFWHFLFLPPCAPAPPTPPLRRAPPRTSDDLSAFEIRRADPLFPRNSIALSFPGEGYRFCLCLAHLFKWRGTKSERWKWELLRDERL